MTSLNIINKFIEIENLVKQDNESATKKFLTENKKVFDGRGWGEFFKLTENSKRLETVLGSYANLNSKSTKILVIKLTKFAWLSRRDFIKLVDKNILLALEDTDGMLRQAAVNNISWIGMGSFNGRTDELVDALPFVKGLKKLEEKYKIADIKYFEDIPAGVYKSVLLAYLNLRGGKSMQEYLKKNNCQITVPIRKTDDLKWEQENEWTEEELVQKIWAKVKPEDVEEIRTMLHQISIMSLTALKSLGEHLQIPEEYFDELAHNMNFGHIEYIENFEKYKAVFLIKAKKSLPEKFSNLKTVEIIERHLSRCVENYRNNLVLTVDNKFVSNILLDTWYQILHSTNKNKINLREYVQGIFSAKMRCLEIGKAIFEESDKEIQRMQDVSKEYNLDASIALSTAGVFVKQKTIGFETAFVAVQIVDELLLLDALYLPRITPEKLAALAFLVVMRICQENDLSSPFDARTANIYKLGGWSTAASANHAGQFTYYHLRNGFENEDVKLRDYVPLLLELD